MLNVIRVIQSEWFHFFHRRQTKMLGVGVLAIMGLSLLLSKGYDYHSAYLAYLAALGGGATPVWLVVLPLVGSFAMGDVVAWRYRTGFFRYERIRQPLMSLVVGQAISTVTFITLLTAAVMLAAILLGMCFLPPMPVWHRTISGSLTITVPGPPSASTPYPTFLHPLFFLHPVIYLLIVTGITALATAFWGLLSLAISVWTTNAYVVTGGPWLVYVGISYIFGGPLMNTPLGSWMPIILSGAFISGSSPHSIWLMTIWPWAIAILFLVICASVWIKEYGHVE